MIAIGREPASKHNGPVGGIEPNRRMQHVASGKLGLAIKEDNAELARARNCAGREEPIERCRVGMLQRDGLREEVAIERDEVST